MFDSESPKLEQAFRILGYAADTIAVLTFAYQTLKKQPPPSWAILVFIVGLLFIFTGKRLRGDFIIIRREIYLDIKKWDGSKTPPEDLMTSYRIDQVKSRKRQARYLVYQDYSTAGHRTVDVINYPVQEKAQALNASAVDLEIDLGTNVGYGKKCVVYSRCEYVNTFPGVNSEYYSVKVSYPTKRLKIAILLPSNKQCQNATVTEIVGATSETLDALPTISENRRIISWEKKNPAFNAKYKITWNW